MRCAESTLNAEHGLNVFRAVHPRHACFRLNYFPSRTRGRIRSSAPESDSLLVSGSGSRGRYKPISPYVSLFQLLKLFKNAALDVSHQVCIEHCRYRIPTLSHTTLVQRFWTRSLKLSLWDSPLRGPSRTALEKEETIPLDVLDVRTIA